MIYIKNNQNSTMPNVSQLDKHIGVVGENLSKSRIFCLPKNFYNLDLMNLEYSFVLQVKPIDDDKLPYLNLLTRLSELDIYNLPSYQKMYLTDEIINNSVFLKWDIQKFDLIKSGDLKTSIKIMRKNLGEIGKVYISQFYIAPDIMSIACEIEPICIFQQVIDELKKQLNKFLEIYNQLLDYVIPEVYSTLSEIKNNMIDFQENIDLVEKILNKKVVLDNDSLIDYLNFNKIQVYKTNYNKIYDKLTNIENKIDDIQNQKLYNTNNIDSILSMLDSKADLDVDGKILLSQLL